MALLIIYDEDDRMSSATVIGRRLQAGVRLVSVTGGASNLIAALDNLLSSRRPTSFNRIVFVTHASPGRIFFGNQSIDANWVTTNMRNRQYEKICPTRSRIYFTGCRVAAGPIGRTLFQSIARIFLKSAGGEIFGHTSDGWTVPFYSWATGHVVHFSGDLVTLYFGHGGRFLGDRTESTF
jgi:hypothetical protein